MTFTEISQSTTYSTESRRYEAEIPGIKEQGLLLARACGLEVPAHIVVDRESLEELDLQLVLKLLGGDGWIIRPSSRQPINNAWQVSGLYPSYRFRGAEDLSRAVRSVIAESDRQGKLLGDRNPRRVSFIVQKYLPARISGLSHVGKERGILTAWGFDAVERIASGRETGNIICTQADHPAMVTGSIAQETALMKAATDLSLAMSSLVRLIQVGFDVEVEWLVGPLGFYVLQLQPLPDLLDR